MKLSSPCFKQTINSYKTKNSFDDFQAWIFQNSGSEATFNENAGAE